MHRLFQEFSETYFKAYPRLAVLGQAAKQKYIADSGLSQ
jgi:hypothetical protein